MYKTFREFRQARDFARSLGLRSQRDWQAYCRGALPGLTKPADIPSAPALAYRDDWQGFGDWLGTGNTSWGAINKAKHEAFLPFRLAREWVHAHLVGHVSNMREWRDYCAGRRSDLPPRPMEIPSNPSSVYANQGWLGYGDWLGTGNLRTKGCEFCPFGEARAFVWSLGLSSIRQWRLWVRGDLPGLPPRPLDIPTHPHHVYYSRGWNGYRDWLGYAPKKPAFRDLHKHARELGLNSRKEWVAYCEGKYPPLPPPLPGTLKSVHQAYAAEWRGWRDFLGNRSGRKKPVRHRPPRRS